MSTRVSIRMADLQELLAVSALIAACERLLRHDRVTMEEEAEIRRLLTQIARVFERKELEHV